MQRGILWEKIREVRQWDLIVIGGGITGAGVFHEATRRGWRTLLLEARDFAWGASSRSGKLVHGGLRYLRQGDLRLVRASLLEREALLRELPGLVEPLGFLFPAYRRGEALALRFGLGLYDLLAGRRTRRWLEPEDFLWLAPHIRRVGLRGGVQYGEAMTDDARLVLRLIMEGVHRGGVALNYVIVRDLLRRADGRVVGVAAEDRLSGATWEIPARVVVNAAGPWADVLRTRLSVPSRLRPLRGIHLMFPHWRFPLAQAVGFFHPVDRRPLYALPWMGVTLVGTTDVDHDQPLEEEPRPTKEETEYLLTALHHTFPHLNLDESDVLAAFAGVRPVVRHGRMPPSREPREHVVWVEQGLVTVTGGKLTTFRVLARDALRAAAALGRLPFSSRTPPRAFLTSAVASLAERFPLKARWLAGRYGPLAEALIRETETLAHAWEPIATTPFLWAELYWALAHEQVVHLDDLLLRRTRLGLVLPQGAVDLLPQLRDIIIPRLGWKDARWEQEVIRYRNLYRRAYHLPGHRDA